MACNKPFFRKIKVPYEHYVLTPCGHCAGCNKDRLNLWSDRCLFETITNERPSCMLTLTYNDEHLPVDRGVHYEDVRAFNLRFRKNLGRSYKYFFSSEYGESDNMRPHYHALLFGFDCEDKKDMAALYNAWSPYRNEIGFFTVDYVTSGRIRYVLKYVTKEFGKDAEKYAAAGLPPLFHVLSKGIGKQWFINHLEECRQNHGYWIDGKLRPLPRYYEELLKTYQSDDFKANRVLKSNKKLISSIFDKTEKKVSLWNIHDVASVGSYQDLENVVKNDIRELTMQHLELLNRSKRSSYVS